METKPGRALDTSPPSLPALLLSSTCEIREAEPPQAVGSVLGIVEEDGQSEASLVEVVSPDDPQLPERKLLKVVHGDEDVAGHLADRLQRRRASSA